nr:RING finger protein 207-like [Anolis sagrei ordinatus]
MGVLSGCRVDYNSHHGQGAMSGGLFSSSVGRLCEAEEARAACHPLVCFLCRQPYAQPCLLDCYHHFCANCLRGRAIAGRLPCPLCG